MNPLCFGKSSVALTKAELFEIEMLLFRIFNAATVEEPSYAVAN